MGRSSVISPPGPGKRTLPTVIHSGKLFIISNSVRLEYVSVGDADQFGPACIDAIESGLESARQRGVVVRALMICNPHNPLGKLLLPVRISKDLF